MVIAATAIAVVTVVSILAMRGGKNVAIPENILSPAQNARGIAINHRRRIRDFGVGEQ